MRFQNSLQLGFRRVSILCFIFLLVAAKEEETIAKEVSSDSQHDDPPLQLQGRRLKQYYPDHHSFDLFVGSKRKVPNTSDPLHNR